MPPYYTWNQKLHGLKFRFIKITEFELQKATSTKLRLKWIDIHSFIYLFIYSWPVKIKNEPKIC